MNASEFDIWLRIGQFVASLLAIGAVLYKMGAMSKSFEMRGDQQAAQITKLETAILKLNDVVVTQAISTTRLDNQETQITQMQTEIGLLRRGRGFIQREVDGEYPEQR